MTDISGLVTTTVLNTKISEVENKILKWLQRDSKRVRDMIRTYSQ